MENNITEVRDKNAAVDSRMMIFDDGSAILVIAVFVNNKCQCITLMMEGQPHNPSDF